MPNEPGNINLYTRPRSRNPDGSLSTVYSMGINENGQEILIPGVDRYGKGILSEQGAIDQFHKTGEHLGKFATPAESNAYGDKLHQDMEAGNYDVPLASSRRNVGPEALRRALLGLLGNGAR